MTIDQGDGLGRAARGMLVGALALACGACGSDRHSHEQASGGKTNAGGRASLGGSGSLGGARSFGGSVGFGGDVAAGGLVSDGAMSDGGAANDGGMAGDGPTQSGGTSSGGSDSGGANAAGGIDTVGGASSGGTSSGGNNSGGVDAAGGVSSGGAGAVGGAIDAAGGNNSGGTNSGGASSGGTNSGGTSAGGASSGGTNSGGAPASCGNAVLEAPEDCDDGNTQNLDGCNAACRYEVVDRMTSIAVQGVSAPAFCSPMTNALGRAFSAAALGQINAELQQSISNGALNNLMQFSGLTDLTGASDESSLALGFLPAVTDTANGSWPGGTPLDFWFRVPAASVDAQGLPLNSLLGSVTARGLNAGPGLLKLPLAIGGSPSMLSVSDARLRATLNATPSPNVPAPPPTNLASGLTVFQSITGNGSDQGICGNVTVESLAHIPVPASLASGGSSACSACTGSRTYTACSGSTVDPGCNSMLDVLVGGCKTLLCFVTVVTPSQPDVAAPGSASVRLLSLGAGNTVPSDQSSGNDDAYSSYFKFNANRAHITGLR